MRPLEDSPAESVEQPQYNDSSNAAVQWNSNDQTIASNKPDAAANERQNDYLVSKGFASASDFFTSANEGGSDADEGKKTGKNEKNDKSPALAADSKENKADSKDKAEESKDTKEKKEPTLNEKIDSLIEKMGDDDFQTRQNAQRDLEKIGSPAFDKLEKARTSHEDLEIRVRAGRAQEEILKSSPTAGRTVAGAHDGALAEIAKTGKMSKETDANYQKLIKEMDGQPMSKAEFDRRSDGLTGKAYDFKAPAADRIDARRKQDELYAARSIAPGDQARLDYADALTKSGDKAKAVDVLKEAVTKNPDLAQKSSFKVLATDSGATKDKSFMEAVDKATGKNGRFKEDIENPRMAVIDRISHMRHETNRKGGTEGVQKDWNNLLDSMSKQAEKEPDMKRFLEIHRQDAHKGLVDGLTHSGKAEAATEAMTRMLKEDPTWVNAAWMRSVSELNNSRSNKAFDAAANEARKVVKRQFDGQDP